MTLRYEEAVPWGRSFAEYQHMFSLTHEDLQRHILGCADGPANFNAEIFKRGGRVVSCDPLYQFTAAQIRERIDVTYETVMEQTRTNQDKFVWENIKSVDELGQIRMAAMNDFLADYSAGTQQGRYITAELPNLPFAPHSFDLALCSHFLFLYSDNFSLAFHEQAVLAMCQVAVEVRIFPVLTYNATLSPYVAPLVETLHAAGYTATLEPVDYEFQRGGNQMLRIVR